MGSDPPPLCCSEFHKHFNPRSPHGERPSALSAFVASNTFQSTLPAWGATIIYYLHRECPYISIHAPRMGSDLYSSLTSKWAIRYFNPRSPHGERPASLALCIPHNHFNPRSPHGERPLFATALMIEIIFQSTLPAWGATSSVDNMQLSTCISIHAPRMGSDKQVASITPKQMHFNPRSPHGERPRLVVVASILYYISIHAPRMGSDAIQGRANSARSNFNPRSPHGERHKSYDTSYLPPIFQSTLPAWGATYHQAKQHDHSYISIHAPRMGSDLGAWGEIARYKISIHAPRMGSDPTLVNRLF